MLIDTVVTLLDKQFSDGRYQFRATLYSDDTIPQRCIVVYYGEETTPIALGRHTPIGLYNQRIQVAIYHPIHDTCRRVAFSAFEWLNTQRPTGLTLSIATAPAYAGVNPVKAQHVYTIDYFMKGDK